MATSNARIQFSTADEETWKLVNPMLREGELIIAKNPSGKYRLYVGAKGGSKFKDSTIVWDEELADSHEKNAAISADAAMTSKSAAASSASYAAQSMNSAKESASAAEQSMNSAKESADKAVAASNNASSSASSAANSESNAIDAKNKATQSASEAKLSELNAKASEKSAANSAAALSYATQEEVNLGIESRKIVSPKTLGTLLNLLQRNTSYKVGDIVYSSKLPSWAYLECTQAGTTAATEPNLSTVSGIEVNDGSAKFRIVDKRMKARATGIVNKKFLGDIGFVTQHIGTVVAEIVGYTEEGYRRVKFTVQCSCIDTGTNTTEFRWLNFYNNSIGIATAYFDKYPQSKFVKHELLTYPMMYCDVLTKEEKGYGAYVELSGGFVNLSRMYTADGKIGMYPNSMLKTGSCMFEFISDFTNE